MSDTLIFYDFETSSRELLGQIMSYAFIVTDARLNPKEILTGKTKLNRTQLPDIDAILTNKIDIDDLQKNGETEFETAEKIYGFLAKHTSAPSPVILAGFNSNQFDIGFLRNLLIKYGLNPYFGGRLINKDVMHFAQFAAFQNTEEFPWVLHRDEKSSYYSFKLQDLAQSFGILSGTQSHDAKEDVELTIMLTSILEQMSGQIFTEFQACQFSFKYDIPDQAIIRQKTRDFVGPDDDPKKFTYTYWKKVLTGKKEIVALNVNKADEKMNEGTFETSEDKLSCLKYVNPNKQFFIGEPTTSEERASFEAVIHTTNNDPFFNSLSLSAYFELIKKDWDIEYQIHAMGFERIDTLRALITHLKSDFSSYETLLKQTWEARKNEKDRYLVQLFNRAYLTLHPNPNPDYLKKYLIPRYVEGTMLRNGDDWVSMEDYEKRLISLTENQENPLMDALKRYFDDFKTQLPALSASNS